MTRGDRGGRLRFKLDARRRDAREAGRALLERAFSGPGPHRVYARIEPSNRAARRLLRELGFRYEGCLRRDKRRDGRWTDQECWAILKEEWTR